MGAQTQFDISTRITGYQSTLKQLQQAIQQLDPGASIRKSLQAAFKNAEAYINKLAKNPIVNVGSEKQLQSLINTLDKATSLITNMSDKLNDVNLSDLDANVLKTALENVNKQLIETTVKLNQVSNGPQLITLAGKVKNLQKVFNGLGQNINELSAAEGLEQLNKALVESKKNAADAQTELTKLQDKVAARVDLFGAKSGGKGTKAIKELQAANIDFDKVSFSPEAVQKFKDQISQKLFKNLIGGNLSDQLKVKVQESINKAFTNGLNAAGLKSVIESFTKEVGSIVSVSSSGIYDAMFGNNTSSLPAATQAAKKILEEFSNIPEIPVERLKQIFEMAKPFIQDKTPILNLIEEGQLKEASAELLKILNLQKEIKKESKTNGSSAEEAAQQTNLEKIIKKENINTKQYENVRDSIINSKEYQEAIQQIHELELKVQTLTEKLNQLQNQKVDNIKQVGRDSHDTAESLRVTTEQAEQYRNKLDEIQSKEKLLGKIQGVVERWFSIYAAVRLVSNAVRSMISTVEELDKTITNIAIVTSMSQNDLWQQMPVYTKTAREFAASISGVYEVSQLYYQQGLQTVDVMKLTEETLKMARISGLDYAESTDYMTNALRSFKMEMQDAGRIVDVYSAIAAKTATDVEELAQAMSKTASSAEAVGSSFENTTAMMAVMIEATRQAPENIGSALKSIISRYGQLKVNPNTLVDSEGQALSLNKVDTALQSVGISIHDAQGQFRDFDDVIMDLAKSWDTIDKNTQRYIATVMAGNRQQSRFLALVSSYERLKETAEIAANSQNAAQLQYLKTLDSIEAKQQQLQTSMQSLYTSTGIQNFYKTLIDLGNSVVQSFTDIPTILNLPIPALLKFGTTFYNIATLVTQMYSMLRARINVQTKAYEGAITANLELEAAKRQKITQEEYDEKVRAAQAAADKVKQIERGVTDSLNEQATLRQKIQGFFTNKKNIGMVASAVGMAATLGATTMSTDTAGQRGLKSALTGLGGLAQGVGTGLMMGGPAGAIMGVLTALPAAIEAVGIAIETTEEKIERYDKAVEQASNKELIAKNDITTLADYQKRFIDLEKKQHDSNQAKQEFINLNAEIAASYPELISNIDSEGNLIVSLGQAYEDLREKKKNAYAEGLSDLASSEMRQATDVDWLLDQVGIDSERFVSQYGDTGNGFMQALLNAQENKNMTLAQLHDYNQGAYSETLPSTIGAYAFGMDINDFLEQESISVTDAWLQKMLKFFDYNNFINNGQLDKQQLKANGVLNESGQLIVDEFLKVLNYKLSSNFANQHTVQELVENISTNGSNEDLRQRILNYSDQLQESVITRNIARLRSAYDAIYNFEGLSGYSGDVLNSKLRDDWERFKQEEYDANLSIQDNFSNWITSIAGIYQNLYKQLDSSSVLQELNKYYSNIDSLSTTEYEQLQLQYQNFDEWKLFSKKYDQLVEDADIAIGQAVARSSNLFTEQAYNEYLAFLKNTLQTPRNQTRAASILSQFTTINQHQAFEKLLTNRTEEETSNLLTYLQQGELDTITGLEKLISQYQKDNNIKSEDLQTDQFVTLLREIQHAIVINFNTEFQNLSEEYTKNLKELDKALKGATSGMDNQDATKLAAQLGTSLSDENFKFLDGKWYYQNLQKIYDAFMPDDGLLTTLNNFIAEGSQYQDTAMGAVPEQYRKLIQDFKKSDKTWEKYVEGLKGNIDGLEQARKVMEASGFLAIGDIKNFVKTLGTTDNITGQEDLYQAVLSGELEGSYTQFTEELLKYYQAGVQEVYDAAVKLLSKEGTTTSVKVTSSNQKLIKDITGKEYAIDEVATLNIEQVANSLDTILGNLAANKALTFKQKVEQMAKFHNAGFEGNTYDAITSVIKSFEEFDISQALMLPQSLQKFVEMNKVTGKYFINLNAAAETLNDTYLKGLGWDNKQINELQATIRKSQRENDIKTIASDIVKNRESLTEENIASIATALGQTYDDVIATLQLQRNQDDTYRMNMNSILQLMNQKQGQLDTVLAQMIAEEIDNIIGNVSNIASNQSKGVTSYAEMQKVAERAQQSGFNVNISDLYEWNDTVHGFVLSAQGIFVEIARVQSELSQISATNTAARELLQGQIEALGRDLANNIDFNAFINSSNNDSQSQVTKNIINAINDYNRYLDTINATFRLNAEVIVAQLRKGGVQAVDAAKTIANLQGKELTDDQIKQAYRVSAEQLLAAANELNTEVGGIVSDTANRLLEKAGVQTQQLGPNAHKVLTSAEDLTQAYKYLYTELSLSGAATLEELNGIVASYFKSINKTEQNNLINKLGNVASMTWDQLAEIFTEAGLQMSQAIGTDLGKLLISENGKVKVTNFEAFARGLGIKKTNSPEYLEAFKSYNDALIKESQFVENTINDELNNLVKAKPGELINLTGLYTQIGDKLAQDIIATGAEFNNGIVQITNATNLRMLVQKIESKAAQQGIVLEHDVQALVDAVQALFKGLADSITKGIQGTLSNTEKADLQSSVRNLIPDFNEDLKFTQTYNGLKLSTDQAIKLYDAMKGVDTVSSHIVFDSLTKQLTKAGEACESMSHAMAEIKRLEKEGTEEARKRADVYREISNMQIQNPESYDWMNRDLPDYLKGPENYWNSLGTAFKALNEAAKEAEEGSTKAAHMLDPTDFYNMVNEFNNVAALSGTEIEFLGHKLNGDMTSAAQLIEQGMRTLSNVDGDGVKVDLTKFGANFTGGAQGMAKGVHEGIQAMAKSQIEMLDGMIQLLETVVAMEGLKDVAGEDNTIDLTDVFPKFEVGDYTVNTEVQKWADKILQEDNTDLQKALDSIVINGQSIRQTLVNLKNGSIKSEQEARLAQQKLNALYQMYLSGDYSLQNLIGSIKQVLGSSGFEGEVKVGEQTFQIGKNYIFEKGKDGYKVPGVGTYEDLNEAITRFNLSEIKGISQSAAVYDSKTQTTTVPLQIGDRKVRVFSTVNGIEYNVNGEICKTYNQAVKKAYEYYVEEQQVTGQIPVSFEQWRTQNHVNLQSTVVVDNPEQVKNATHKQIQELAEALVSGEDIEAKAQAVGINVKIQGDITQADFQKIASAAGIDTKTLALSLATEVVGDNAENVKKILAGQHLEATVDLTGEFTNLNTTQDTLTYDEQVSVTLANIKAMATAESINWDGITTLINTVPEDKRPTVETYAKEYIVKALFQKYGLGINFEGFPELLTSLQGVPMPTLQALAQTMNVIWGKNGTAVNNTNLTQVQVDELAKNLGIPSPVLSAIANAIKITSDGKLDTVGMSLTLKLALAQLFPGGQYKPETLQQITMLALAAAIKINGEGATATGTFEDEYQVTNKVPQVAADIIKLIVSTNASTTTEEGTTFNADNWQGTVDKIYAVAALLEVGLQNEADINVDGTNIPSNVATTKTIEALRASAAVLNVIFQENPTGENINVEEVDKAIAKLEKQDKIQASDIKNIKAIVTSILFKPKDDNIKPQGLDTLIPKDSDGKYNAGKLTVKYQTEVEFTDSVEEAYKALRDQLYTISQGTNAGLYEIWGNKSFVNPQTGVTTFLDQLLDKVVNKGHILTRAEQNILNNYKAAIEAAPEELANNFKQINMRIDALIDENDLNISNQQEQFSILSQTFSQLDPTKLQECATAMSELAESAQKVKDVPWQEIVNGVNNINNIETPNEDLATASTIMRTIQASLSVVPETGDTVAAEIISPEPLQRTVQLLADTTALDEALKKIRQSTITIDLNQNEQEQNTVQAPTNNNAQQGIKAPDTDGINDLIKAAENAVTQATGLFDNVNQALAALQSSSTKSETTVNNLSESIREIPSGYDRYVSWLADAMYDIPNVAWVIRDLNAQLQALGSDPIQIVLEVSGEAGAKGTANTIPFSYGHPAYLTFAKGNALAQGKVLMGELGPELVVSNGKFFVVGQAGAQMVDLAPDAIVFNHLQTKRLLSSGHAGRGKPVTNERTAVSRAKGSGNALASASSALAALKQIRAMWQSMLNASMKDLGSLAGQEAGKVASGSGGSSSDPNRPASIGAVIEEIERWYNLLRQIDKLEKDITYQQNLQAKIASDRIANGKAMYTSYRQEIEYLDQQIERNQQLADLQKSWYERKRQELVDSDYGKIFTYDENGQLQYRHGTNLGLDVLEKLTRRDIYGKTSGASTNARTQINYLRQIGFKVDKLRYNDDGSVIKPEDYEDNPDQMYVDMMQNYWDRLDSWKEELDGIYDSYTDQLNNIVTNETKRNQILQKIVDNQLSVEQDVVHAIESREQKLIDQLSDEREALEKSNKDFIDGLTDQLNQQREMYKNNENEKDLVKLRRQIAILQRSGGSASAINSLQSQLASKEQDQYFTMQQQQISAIQQASDLQLERMDAQIDLMTETLEYQKEHGLLWEEVYQVMAGTPEQIRQFIVENTPDFESASALDVAEKIRDIDLRINEWVGYRDDQTVDMTSTTATGKVIKGSVGYTDWNSYLTSQDNRYADRASDILKERARQKFEQVLSETGDLRKAGEAADAIFKEVLGDSAGIYHEYQNIPEKQTTPEDTHKPTETVPEHNYNNYYKNDDYNYNRNNNTNKNTSSTSSSDKKTFVFKSYNETQMNDLKSQIMNASSRSEQQPLIKKYNQLYDSLPQHRKKLYHRYKSGGLVDYTGLAQVDGTPSRPEAFINAEQTQLLRKYLFGDSNASLLSLAQSIAQQLHGISYISDTNYQEEDSHVNIENVDVNVNIKQVANDYDVRAMGATVMDEILNIARKSGTRSLSRR